jgi:hypothetical protein
MRSDNENAAEDHQKVLLVERDDRSDGRLKFRKVALIVGFQKNPRTTKLIIFQHFLL